MNLNSEVSRSAIAERAKALLHEIGKLPLEEITEDASFDTTLALESMQLIQLVVALEEEFGAELDPLHMVELSRLGDIVDYIHARVEETRGGRV